MTLTYLIATRNKLPYLREQFLHLLENVQPDEEIIVIDGKSTDGAAEYLANLRSAGKITELISEPDRCEAHALNKGLMKARGELIKIISDDDVFDWPAIKQCKQFMLEHQDVDVVSGNIGYAVFGSHYENIVISQQYFNDYLLWLSTGRAFGFTGLAFIIRRTSLPLIGLFHTAVRSIDHEYALRMTSVANVAWYTALTAVRVHNPGSNYQYDDRSFEADRKRIFSFYGHQLSFRRRLLYLRLKLVQIERDFRQFLGVRAVKEPVSPDAFHDFYELIAGKMREQNLDASAKFLYKGMPDS